VEQITVENIGDETSEDEAELGHPGVEETPPTSDDEGDYDEDGDSSADAASDDEDSTTESDDANDLSWGPCWPVRHFFEMLKNHCRRLRFIPKDTENLINTWTDLTEDRDPIPEGIPELLQSIYHKHGWPDLNRYCKRECLDEVKQKLQEKYPEHYKYYIQ
jgi:hypothetical protein